MTTTRPAPATCVGAVLFTDLVGFTEFNDLVGDAAALQVLDHQTSLASAMASRWPEARIVKELGDGLMIWFASAADGLAGATALLAAIDEARDAGDFPLAVRMGLHHGEATVRGDDLIGQTVNVAARVAALAGPSELLVSESVIAACDDCDHPPVTPVGPVEVRGVHTPIWLHRYSP